MIALAVLSLLVGAGVLACAIVSRARVGRLPRSLVVEYAPLRGADVLSDGILAGRERRAVSAALIDLAVRRKVRLLADTSAGKRATVGVEVVDGAHFEAREVALLEALFGREHPGHRVRRFSKDRRAVGRTLRALMDRQAEQLTAAGLIDGWHRGRTVLRVLGALGLIWTLFFTFVAVVGSDEVPSMIVFGAALATAIAALVVTPVGRARRFTPAAEAPRTHLDGMRQYLQVAEADRLRVLQAPGTAELLARLDLPTTSEPIPTELEAELRRFHLHERLLPYAILFGIEREWLSHLKLAYDELGDTSMAAVGDVVGSALEVTGELLILVDAVGSLVELGFAVGELADGAGAVLEAVGGIAEALGDLAP